MAIPKELEPLVEGFSQEELKLFDNLVTKQYEFAKAKDPNAPTLQEGWLRQQEFDKRSNEWKKRTDTAEDLAKRRNEWYEQNKPIHDAALEHARELEARAQTLEQQQAELRQKLTEAEARRVTEGGETVDWAELDRRVEEKAKTMGWVSKSELQELAKQESSQMAREAAREEATKAIVAAKTELWEKSFPEIANHAADISEIAYDHKSEFNGESLNRTEFSAFLKEKGISDFKAGYTDYVKPRRDEREFKKRVDAEVQQRLSGITVQGGSPVLGGPQEKGALQQRIERDNAALQSVSAASAAAAAEMRAEGKY
jgi:hypothetical protein